MGTDVRAEFGRATAMHREGRLADAVDIYRRVLKARPGLFEVQRLLALALLQSGRAKEAHAVARRAREDHPSNPHAHVMMGAALQSEHKWERALAAFEAGAVLDPGLVEAHYLAGNMLATLGRHAEAAARFDRVIALDPRVVEARANRAVALSLLGRPQEALADCDALVELQPWEPRHVVARGGTLMDLGRFAEAAQAAQAALRIKPDLPDALVLKGEALFAQDDLAGARDAFAAALAAAPDRPALPACLARAERLLGNRAAARAVCEAALARDPSVAPVWQELAELCREQGDAAGALQAVETALAAAPDFAPALALRARLLADPGPATTEDPEPEEAPVADPPDPLALYRRGIEDLAEGRWEAGWAGYEHRAAAGPVPPFPRWDGVEMPSELIVTSEADIADQFLFGRLLRLVADRGIRARLLAHSDHAPLLARIDARVPVICDLAEVDIEAPGLRHIPLGSLPGLIAPDPAGWPRPPYLTAEPARVARWRGLRGEGVMVGICWRCDADNAGDGDRSAPLEAFAPLAALPGLELFSLQRGAGMQEIETCSFAGDVNPLAASWDAGGLFLDTAALLQHIDVVVTTDGALAHLAGARDVPTILALPAACDWPWGREGDTTPLYPSLRLFRQRDPGNWDTVFADIAAFVAERMARLPR